MLIKKLIKVDEKTVVRFRWNGVTGLVYISAPRRCEKMIQKWLPCFAPRLFPWEDKRAAVLLAGDGSTLFSWDMVPVMGLIRRHGKDSVLIFSSFWTEVKKGLTALNYEMRDVKTLGD